MNKQKYLEYKLNEIDVDRQIRLRKHGVWSHQEDQLFKAIEAVVNYCGSSDEFGDEIDTDGVRSAILEKLEK